MDNYDSNAIFDKDSVDFNYKIILVGHQRVGKTSIINRFINDNFNDDEGESKTFQIQKKMMKIEKSDKWAQLHIWDTLGQENYKSLSPLFFRKSIGAFLVFDCTSMESFREIDSWFE
jgi:small GTP-binding protein